ncbi:MFS transporter [Enterobacter sp. Ap-916]|uniref:MFS transporter n=1 Tax=unclassified Enterobacter TaxID=2608935 RepID=UPI001421A527|nr:MULTISPECIES: MFS transporter [unclassified Enterobacter]NIF57056.1 MFS transporter [Enterobacter sp. Ap-867]NIG29003.1 MFS transporter [Enterobacter sp. Ap-916]
MSDITSQNASWATLLSGHNGLRSLALAGGVALHAINIYIVTTILPTVIQEIGGLAWYAWNTTLFVAASIVGSAISAKLIARQGAAMAYLSALLLFSCGAVICALAPSMPVMLLGRVVQGLGGGVLFALSYALIRVAFEAPLWSRAMALVSGMWGIATLCGPAIGGVFAEIGEWRLAFWALLPIAAVLALIVMVQFRSMSKPEAGEARLPVLTISLLVLSVLAISLAGLGGSLALNISGIAVGLGLGWLIARLDSRPDAAKLLPRGAYSPTRGIGLLYAMMALLVIGLTTEIYVPYFLQLIHLFSPLSAGYLTAMMAGGWTLAALCSASVSSKMSQRIICVGPLVVLVSLVTLSIIMPTPFNGPAGVVACGTALAGVGFGIGLAWPHLLTKVFQAASPGEETLASASITTVQLYATALAAALAGVITNGAGITSPGGVEGASAASMALFGAFALAPAGATLLAIRLSRQAR